MKTTLKFQNTADKREKINSNAESKMIGHLQTSEEKNVLLRTLYPSGYPPKL